MTKKLIGAILQARMGSNRFPGKVMMEIDSKNPLLYYVIKQLQNSRYLDKIIVATTNLQQDDVISEFVNKLGIDIFRGSENDVLDRYYQCAKKFSISTVVRITCDNPLIDPNIVDKVILEFNNGNYDFGTNVFPRTYPYGTETEIIPMETLEKIWKEGKDLEEREHVTEYVYRNSKKFKIVNVENHENISHLRWTVDETKDLDFVREIVKRIDSRPIFLEDILSVINKEPNLVKINQK